VTSVYVQIALGIAGYGLVFGVFAGLVFALGIAGYGLVFGVFAGLVFALGESGFTCRRSA
jgi:hypothetical protein